MHPHSDQPGGVTPSVASCWNTIGVRGDRSCPELDVHVHCRNCPVYSGAAAALLDRPAPAEFTIDRTRHFEAPKAVDERETQSVVIFRIGREWFALPTPVIAEVAERRVIHSLPHRRAGIVLGVVNVRGELLVCVSLGRLLGLESPGESIPDVHRTGHERFLVVRGDGVRVVLPVDEVSGVQRFHARALKEVPTTVSKAATAHSRAVLSWSGHVVGLLDDHLLFRTLHRSVG
jgi:chemotaxis-related protein WspD